jgi:hypothetical protein
MHNEIPPLRVVVDHLGELVVPMGQFRRVIEVKLLNAALVLLGVLRHDGTHAFNFFGTNLVDRFLGSRGLNGRFRFSPLLLCKVGSP